MSPLLLLYRLTPNGLDRGTSTQKIIWREAFPIFIFAVSGERESRMHADGYPFARQVQ